MRFSTHSFTAAALLTTSSFASLHHIYTSSFTSPDIFLLEFDDVARSIKQLKQIPAHSAHPTLSFSYDKTVMYAGEKGGWASYAVGIEDNGISNLAYNSSVPVLGSCADKFANYQYGSTAVTSEARGPYMVYGAPFGNCGNAIAVTTELVFDYVSQNFTYNKPESAVRGVAMDADNTMLYSADLGANGIWVHSINPLTGLLTNVGFLPAHLANAGPRKIVVHPGGKYLYVLLERANVVAVYAVNRAGPQGFPAGPISFTGLTYSLLPKGENPASYWASDIALSEDGTMLIATTRYRLATQTNSWDTVPPQAPYQPPPYQYFVPSSQALGSNPRGGNGFSKEKRRVGSGYVTSILLTPNEDGSGDPATYGNRIGPGYPLRVLFQQQTSGSGGISNSISPASWGRQFFAITDSEYGVVEVWKIEGIDEMDFNGDPGTGALTATLGGWVAGTWSQSAVLSYENQYAQAIPGIPDPLAVTSTRGGINTTVPRPFVPESYYEPKSKPGSPPSSLPPPITATQPVPTQQPYQPYNPQQSQQPYNPQQPYRPPPPRPQSPRPQLPPQLQSPTRPLYPQQTQAPGRPRLPPQQSQPQQGWSQYPPAQQPGRQPARPQYQPYTPQQSLPWNRNGRGGFKRFVRRWLGFEEIEKRQLQSAAPYVSARVFASWQAGYVKSSGPQAGCCTNALWYD